jgi:hypothetical protein
MWESNRLWRTILEISTLLGGLAALVFFYDRFRHRLEVGSKDAPNLKDQNKKLLSAGATALAIGSCGLTGFLGFRFGLMASIAGWLGCMFVLWGVVANLLPKVGLANLEKVGEEGGLIFSCAWAITMAVEMIWASIMDRKGVIIYESYAGSTLSIASAVSYMVLGIWVSYGMLWRRQKWFGDPW